MFRLHLFKILLPIIILITIGCTTGNVQPTATPESTATPEPAATQEPTEMGVCVMQTESSSDGDTDNEPTYDTVPLDEKTQALIEVIGDRIAELRKLDKPSDFGDKVAITRSEFRKMIEEDSQNEEAIENSEITEAIFKLLGLIPNDADLTEINQSLYGSIVAGFYDTELNKFATVKNTDELTLVASDEIIIAHEYVHLLQDCYFDLVSLEPEEPSKSDQVLAISSLIEGDASRFENVYVATYDSNPVLPQSVEEPLVPPDLDSIPQILIFLALAPYEFGEIFVDEIVRKSGIEGLNSTFANPPVSTEQILFPEKYFSKELPLEVSFESPFNDNWEEKETDIFGSMFLYGWLVSGTVAPPSRQDAIAVLRAIDGWNGDYAVTYQNEQDQWAHAGIIAWDGANDADEFVEQQTKALNNNSQFTTIDISTLELSTDEIGLWDGQSGVIGWLNFNSDEYGKVSGYVASPTLNETLSAMENLSGLTLTNTDN